MLSASLLASIPSPTFDSIELGPLTLRLYGLAIAVGVVAAVVISSRRWEARGGSADDIGTIAIWAVPAGVVGSRIYHVATDWRSYQGDWGSALDITQGGLGIPGGIFFGTLVGWLVVRAKGLPVRPLLDVAAPAIPVAQAIGRLGNWFNQELFGRPTDLPWGLEIDQANRPIEHADSATFHPTFLYEGLWNLALAVVLVRLDRARRLRPAQLFCLYVLGYGVGRLWIEMLRADPASLILGVRVNIWMSIVISVAALAVFAWLARGPAPEAAAHRAPVVPEAGGDADADAGGDGETGDEAGADAEAEVDDVGDDDGAGPEPPGEGGGADEPVTPTADPPG